MPPIIVIGDPANPNVWRIARLSFTDPDNQIAVYQPLDGPPETDLRVACLRAGVMLFSEQNRQLERDFPVLQ